MWGCIWNWIPNEYEDDDEDEYNKLVWDGGHGILPKPNILLYADEPNVGR